MTSPAEQSDHYEHQPSPRFARFVERAVGYRLAGYPAGVHVGMPSGTVTLVVPLDAPLTVADGGSGPTAYGSVLAGLSTAPAHIHHDGNQHGVQLALRPGAVRALFGVRAAEVAGESYELADVMGPAATSLREQLHETASWATRFALVAQVLLDLERDGWAGHEPAPEVTEAWRLIRTSGGAAPIRDVAARVGWSMRRLQTRFNAEFGVTPKALSRVRRLERSLPLVAAAEVSLADVAAHCGWSDHAHMDRDWRELAGTSPSRWRTEDVLIGV
ncbi:helix-turn-helix domain-containing protein [Humibacillus xanthopallidus]|uniref:helix-turn-helix domain-containing protein n=1 Tax=Humibacillus xanthopallidus TaxID=412689 RepID=UPI00385044E5